MTIRKWLNGHQGYFPDGTQWRGGVAPAGHDTAVIGDQGDAPPRTGSGGGFVYQVGTGQSAALLFSGQFIDGLYPEILVPQQNGTIFEYRPAMPTASQVPAGLTIGGLTLDLFGHGSLASALLQNTTLAAASQVNVVGTALLDGYYDNSLGGIINVGEPTSLAGKAVVPPAANSHGAVSELDISLSGDGSWGSSGNLDRYVPTMTNAGTIRIGNASQLRLEQGGGAGGPITIPGYDIYVAPTRTAFVNTGTIALDPGALFLVNGFEGTVGTADTSGAYTTFRNDGVIDITGSAGKITGADFIFGEVAGSGTISIDGGTQTAPTQTGAVFSGVVNTNLAIQDGSVVLVADGVLGPNFGPQFFGGGISLHGVAEVEITQGPYFPTQSIAGVITMPISGFQAGDSIVMQVAQGVSTQRASFSAGWDHLHQLLTITEFSTDLFGHTTAFTAATLTLEGSYRTADFALGATALTANGNALFQVTLTTSKQ